MERELLQSNISKSTKNRVSFQAVDTKTLGITTTTLTFDAALDYCRSNGADLTSITSAFENSFIQNSKILSKLCRK